MSPVTSETLTSGLICGPGKRLKSWKLAAKMLFSERLPYKQDFLAKEVSCQTLRACQTIGEEASFWQ